MPRVKKYDREAVLAKAMWVFWQNGFLGTSIQDLVEGMGINRFSIYDSFESKEHLFLLSLNKYQEQILDSQLAILNDSAEGLESISVYFNSLVLLYTSGKVPPRCLMATTIAEFGNTEPTVMLLTKQYLDLLDEGFIDAMNRARGLGEISVLADIPSLSKLLTGLSQGIGILADTMEKADLERMISQLPIILQRNN